MKKRYTNRCNKCKRIFHYKSEKNQLLNRCQKCTIEFLKTLVG